MELRDRVVVVTGGASGIGRALCRAFAVLGARGVVVGDIDGAGAAVVADELAANGGHAVAVAVDVGQEASVIEMIGVAEAAYGPIDLYCSNAGIAIGGGVEVGNDDWERIWQINVMAHVYATRAVLPGMLARGEGHVLITASAAGLLTQPGSAPYSVTKHAAVALAEWLAMTHGDAGIGVSCLCPQGVRTKMTQGMDSDGGRGAASPVTRDGMLEPDVVAGAVVEALAREQFLILPHPEVATYERRRAEDRERWLAGMRRLQARIDAVG